MAVRQRNIHKDWRLVGVYASTTTYLAGRGKTTASEGDVYYDTTLNAFRAYDGSSWSSLGGGSTGAGTWENVMAAGAKVTGAYAPEIEISASSYSLLTLDANGTTNVDILDIASAGGSGDLINLTQEGTGKDINGTSATWSVTKAGVAALAGITLADDKSITMGTSSDAILQWDQTRLALTAAADSTLRIGAAAFSYDVEFIGNTATTNLMKWDLNGGADAVGSLVFDNADLDMGDSDQIRIGDAQDVTIKWDTTNLLIEAATQDTGEIRIGSTNAMNFAVYGNTNTDIALFDASAPDLILNGWDLQLLDDDLLEFGDAKDVSIVWDQTNLLIEAVTQDTGQIKIGTTNAIDLKIFDNAATGSYLFDCSTSQLAIDGCDLWLKDDDYLLLGDSATAGGTTDGTLRWDNSNSVVEIIGSTKFEGATNTFDGNVAVTGTFSLTGAFSPTSLALADTKTLVFGDGSDLTISATTTTATMAIAAGSALAITGSGGNTVTWGATGANINNVLYGTLKIGEDATGYDVTFYSDTTGDYCLWDQNADTNGAMIFNVSGLCINDDTTLRFGTGAAAGAGDFTISCDQTNLNIAEVSAAGKVINIGVDNKGMDVKIFGETSGSYLLWDQNGLTNGALLINAGSLCLADGDKIYFGSPLLTGDFTISATTNVLSIQQVAAGTGEIYNGVDAKGIDETWFAETASAYMKWDQDGNTNVGALTFNGSGILMNDDSYIDLGSSSDITILWDQTRLKIDGAAADTAIWVGYSNNQDLLIYGDTTTDAITFDTSAESCAFNGFDLTLQDDDILKFGDSSDITVTWDQSKLVINGAAADTSIAIGAGNNQDLLIYGGTSTRVVTFDTDDTAHMVSLNGFDLNVQDDDKIIIGDSTSDIQIFWDQTELNVNAGTANGTIAIGKATNTDVQFNGTTAGVDCEWNASSNMLHFLDSAFLGIGGAADAAADITLQWDTTRLLVDAAAADSVIRVGATNNLDLLIYGGTSTRIVTFDTDDTAHLVSLNGFDLRIEDDDILKLGDSSDITITWDQTRLILDGAAADTVIAIGFTNNQDIIVYGDTTTDLITMDTSAELVHFDGFDLQLKDDDKLIFGDSTNADIVVQWDQTELQFDAGTANGTVAFGKTTATDISFNGASAGVDMEWNASSNMLHFLDSAVLGVGGAADAAADVTVSWDQTRMNIDAAAANTAIRIGNTNNLDIVIHGETNTSTITFDTDDTAASVTFNAFELVMNDDDRIRFGDSSDITMEWDQTQFNIDGAAADTTIRIGYVNNQDVVIYGDTTTDAITFDTSAESMAMDGFDLTLKDDDFLRFGDSTSDCYITWDQTRLQIVPSSNVFIGDKTNYVSISSAGAFTQAGSAVITCNLVAASFGGLILPTHASSSPSGAGTAGSVYYEQDASKLWVSAGGTNWVGTVLS